MGPAIRSLPRAAPSKAAAARSALRAGLFAAALWLGACAPNQPMGPTPPTSPPDSSSAPSEPVALRVLYLIHGDADYSWHDADGRRLSADREALRQAVDVAERAPRTEVFIFHQRPPRTGWLDGEPKDGTFYHYRAGTRLRRETYTRAADAPYLQAEAALLRREPEAPRTRADSSFPPPRTVLVYFGHEIPLRDRSGYFNSDPERKLSVARFARGLESLTPRIAAGKPVDLLVLSTCYGGTPVMMNALKPLAAYAVASPAYLHLSFLDTRAVIDFTRGLAPGNPGPPGREAMRRLADSVAARSFESLRARTQTEVTVAVYDLENTGSFLESPTARAQKSAAGTAWKDCAETSGFDADRAAHGVELLYRPPRFGPAKDRMTRSAWECVE